MTLSPSLTRDARAAGAIINAGHVLAGITGFAVAGLVVLGFRLAEGNQADATARVPPPAQDSLVQFVDLNRVARFRAIDDQTVIVTDDTGRDFTMQLTEACPGLTQARDFSFVTEGSRELDRFTAIALNGRVCTFKDFSSRRG